MQTALVTALFVLGCSLAAAPVCAAGADPGAVRRVLGEDVSVAATPMPGNHAQLVDVIARRVTAGLGQHDSAWKPANPLWPNVYGRVRADLEQEAPTLSADLAAANQRASTRLVTAIAAEVSSSDVEQILAYYDTAQGRRYVAFIGQLHALVAHGAVPPADHDPRAAPPPLPDELRGALGEMVMLSPIMQAAMAGSEVGKAMHADTSGLVGVGFMMTARLLSQPSEAVALHAQYAGDIPAFAEFEKTAPEQSVFRALARATFFSKQPPSLVIDEVVAAAEQRHGNAWPDFYRSETGRRTTPEVHP